MNMRKSETFRASTPGEITLTPPSPFDLLTGNQHPHNCQAALDGDR